MASVGFAHGLRASRISEVMARFARNLEAVTCREGGEASQNDRMVNRPVPPNQTYSPAQSQPNDVPRLPLSGGTGRGYPSPGATAMCTVSMVSGGWRDQFPNRYPNTFEHLFSGAQYVGKAEFDALRAEVVELRKLLEAAIKFDEKTGQPECHVDEKVALIKKVAEFVGVDLSDVLK